MLRQIILASQSKQRFNILKTLNLDFEVMPADLDEKLIQADSEPKRAKKVAQAKAETVAQDYPEAIIIAADTYGFLNGQALEKPENLEEAREMLRLMSGQKIIALTGFCYLDQKNQIEEVLVKQTECVFRKLYPEEIEDYVQTEPVLTWSAAFCPAYIKGMSLVAEVNGPFTAFTHGLPIEEVTRCLEKSGVFINK